MLYKLVLALHILSSTLLFGTGLGTAFHFFMAQRSRDLRILSRSAEQTVLADWLFILPSGIFQVASGALLVHLAGWDWHAPWLVSAVLLVFMALGFWVVAVWVQIRIRDICRSALTAEETRLPGAVLPWLRLWFWLGWPAFLGLVAVFFLMVIKPQIW
jgi:uncharacterized membrane protein